MRAGILRSIVLITCTRPIGVGIVAKTLLYKQQCGTYSTASDHIRPTLLGIHSCTRSSWL